MPKEETTFLEIEDYKERRMGEGDISYLVASTEEVCQEIEKERIEQERLKEKGIINRIKPFDPVKFIGKGWSIIEAEQDKRSLAIIYLDLNKILLRTTLKHNETSISGEENIARLMGAGYILLDAKIFQTLREDEGLIPKQWEERVDGQFTYIHFKGTILRNPYGDRCVLGLYWSGGRWHWDCYWLGDGWECNDLSAVLASDSNPWKL